MKYATDMPVFPPENVLARRRLHWGVFVLPALALIALCVLMLSALLIFHFADSLLQQFQPHAGRNVGGLPILLLAFLELLVGLPLLTLVWFTYLKSSVTLTDRLLIFRTGVLSRVTGELPLKNVEAIILAEPLLGRLLGYGTIVVTSVGGLQFPLHFLPRHVEFHGLVQQAVRGSKSATTSLGQTPLTSSDDDSRYMPRR